MFLINYKGMNEEELKASSDKHFAALEESGRTLAWFARVCDVTPVTVSAWKKKGAPIMILRILDGIILSNN